MCAHTTVDLTDAEEKNARVRASVSRLINFVRDYETEESVDDDSPNLVAEASNAGRQLFETVQRSEQNTELINFREKRADSQQVEDKYLNVLEHGKNVAKTNDVMDARLDYREVATHYGCAYTNDGYRAMEEMDLCLIHTAPLTNSTMVHHRNHQPPVQ